MRRRTCRPHPCSPAHAALVESYRLAREAAEDQAEDVDQRDEAPVVRFRDWLRPGWSGSFA